MTTKEIFAGKMQVRMVYKWNMWYNFHVVIL